MSGYIIDDGEEITIINNGKEIQAYWILYSDLQRKRFKKVLNQLMTNWDEVKKQMLFYISYNIDTNDFMKRVSKIYFMTLRNSSQYENDKRQRDLLNKTRIKKLNKLRKTKTPI